jgi:hypothetical protein
MLLFNWNSNRYINQQYLVAGSNLVNENKFNIKKIK